MSNASFIQAMPKVELNLFLEGAVPLDTLMRIADQNEIADSLKHFENWAALMAEPEYARTYEILRMASSWLKSPEDLTRVVYDVATTLAKQNIRYAEISVNPAYYPDLNVSYDEFLAAINDGRDRARRAWGIDLAWIYTLPREEPRRADELARWVTTAAARRGGVVGLGLSGDEKAQPVGQFERAFHTVEKKEVSRMVRTGSTGVEGLMQAIEILHPNRVIDAWGVVESPDALTALADNVVSLVVNLTRAQHQGWVDSVADYPLRRLYDEGVTLVLGADMPSIDHTTLTDEYLAAVEQGGLTLDELETVALNAVRTSFMDGDALEAMAQSFTEQYAALRAEQVAAEEAAP